MAFADLFLGALSLPVYIYDVGYEFHLWTTFVGNLWTYKPILIPYMIVDTAFSQASLISAVFITCERFYAIRWPFKHRNLSTQAYRIAIFSVWVLALLISATMTGSNLLFSYKYTVFFWGPYTLILILITCGCNIGIWQKFQTARVAASHQESRDLQNKRLTKTLLIVSGLTLLAWLPLVLLNFLMFVWVFHVPRRFYDMVNLFNYFNSFVNPIFYALRIAEFRRALALCCTGRHVQAAWSVCIRNWSVNSKKEHNICCNLASSLLPQNHLKMTNMSSSTSAGVSRRNDTNDVYDGTQGEGIALCSALTLTFILVVVGNLLTIVPILISYMIVDTAFSQASLISAVFITCERFYAIRWPFKHRNLSTQAYRIAIFLVWVLAFLISATVTGSYLLFSYKYTMFFWGPYTLILILITCGCNIGIWKKFKTGRVAASHQESREFQNKRLTKTLLIVSGLTLLAWLPLVLSNFLMDVWFFHVPRRFYDMVNLFNYFNSFVNPIFNALRIAEFRRALALCCTGRHVQAAVNTKLSKRRKERHGTTEFSRELALEQDVMDTEISHEVAFEQNVMDTKM
ncbi:unnamed protein product [Pocillopora meandrina]|uniref:G-protein coupled receptors family 1 profile domain-containing protein n=1 Tax=Pocillopora meandrina TaxID=46732 RepID=A0AAU9VSA2_9CNID|nr:unnamed protein product [Pocillopora meandrina]